MNEQEALQVLLDPSIVQWLGVRRAVKARTKVRMSACYLERAALLSLLPHSRVRQYPYL